MELWRLKIDPEIKFKNKTCIIAKIELNSNNHKNIASNVSSWMFKLRIIVCWRNNLIVDCWLLLLNDVHGNQRWKKKHKFHLPNHTRWIHKTSWSPWASIVFANDFVLISIHIVCAGSILVNGNFPSWWIIILAFCVLLLWMLLWRLRWLCRCLLIWLLTIAIFHQHGRKIHTIFVGQSFMFLIIVCKFEEKKRDQQIEMDKWI